MRIIGIETNAIIISIKSSPGSIEEVDINKPIKIREATVKMNQSHAISDLDFFSFLVNICPEHFGHAPQESDREVPH